MYKRSRSRLTRRDILKGAAILGATATVPIGALSFPRPAIAKGLTPVNFSLPWVPEGGTNFVYPAKQFWEERGLDVTINRGYGSVATAQAVSSGQFDLAMCSGGAAALGVMKGLSLKMIATCAYDSTMGVAVPDGGPIKSPKDLAGKKVGIVPTSGEAPYFPAYLELLGIDKGNLNEIALDAKVLEQALIRGQVDAITMFGVSSIPVFVSQGFPVKSFLYSAAGLPFYGLGIAVRPDFLQKNEDLCGAFILGLMDGLKFSLLNPDETIKLHLEMVPEVSATTGGEEYARLGMGIFQVTVLADEAKNHSLGYGNLDSIQKQIDAIKTYVAEPQDKALSAAEFYSNDYIGNVTLSADEWAQVKSNNEHIAQIMGRS